MVTALSLSVAAIVFILLGTRAQSARQRRANDIARIRLQAALNAVPVEFVEYDKDRRLVLANQAARNASPWSVPGAASGKTIDEVMGAYVAHFATPETAEAWKSWAAEAVAAFDRGGVSDSLRPDGQWRRSYVSDMPGGGRVVVRADVTEIKRHEEQLAAETALLRSVLESTGAGILMLDRELRVVLANQFVLDVQGMTPEQLIGRSYLDLVVAGLDRDVIQRWQNASGPERLTPVVFERASETAAGAKRIFRSTANPVQDGDGRLRYIVIIGVDDTERRLGEIRLIDAARMVNLGEMATGMAHEINQPLAIIRLAAESLIEEFDTPEAAAMGPDLLELAHAKLARISAQTERAATLVNELRAVARKPTDNPTPFDVNESVRIANNLLHEQLKASRIYLDIDVPDAPLMAKGETARLQQVLINLALNARDAVLEKVPASAGPLGHISIKVAASAGKVGIAVEDDGPGIAEAVLGRVFEPFFTTKPTGKGTGLGLSISHDIVKRMGGDITAGNRPGGGARFEVVLPLVAAGPP